MLDSRHFVKNAPAILSREELFKRFSPKDLDTLFNDVAWADSWATVDVNGQSFYVPSVALSSEQKDRTNALFVKNGTSPIPFAPGDTLTSSLRFTSKDDPAFGNPVMEKPFAKRVFGDDYSREIQAAISNAYSVYVNKHIIACQNLGLDKKQIVHNVQKHCYDKAETFVRQYLNDPARLAVLEAEREKGYYNTLWKPNPNEPHHRAIRSKKLLPPAGEWDFHERAKAIRALYKELAPKAVEYCDQIGVKFTPPQLLFTYDKGSLIGASRSNIGVTEINLATIGDNPDVWTAVLAHECMHETCKDHLNDLFSATATGSNVTREELGAWKAQRERTMEIRVEYMAAQMLGTPRPLIRSRLFILHNERGVDGSRRLKKMPEKITHESLQAAITEIKRSYGGKQPERRPGTPLGHLPDLEMLEELAKLDFGFDEQPGKPADWKSKHLKYNPDAPANGKQR